MESTIQVKHACMVCFFSFFFKNKKNPSIPMAFSVWLHFQCPWQLIVSHSMLNEIYHGYNWQTHRMPRGEIVLKTRLRACIELLFDGLRFRAHFWNNGNCFSKWKDKKNVFDVRIFHFTSNYALNVDWQHQSTIFK